MKINIEHHSAMKVMLILALILTVYTAMMKEGFLSIFNFLMSLVIMFFLYIQFKEDRNG